MTNRTSVVLLLLLLVAVPALGFEPGKRPVGFEVGRDLMRVERTRTLLHEALGKVNGANYANFGFKSEREYKAFEASKEEIQRALKANDMNRVNELYRLHGRALNQVMSQSDIAFYQNGQPGGQVVRLNEVNLKTLVEKRMKPEAVRDQMVASHVGKFDVPVREGATRAQAAKEIARGMERTLELANVPNTRGEAEGNTLSGRLQAMEKVLQTIETGKSLTDGKDVAPLSETKAPGRERTERQDLEFVLDSLMLLGSGPEHFAQLQTTLSLPAGERATSLAGLATIHERYLAPLKAKALAELAKAMGKEFNTKDWENKPLKDILMALQERDRAAYDKTVAEFRNENSKTAELANQELIKLMAEKKFPEELALFTGCSLESTCLPDHVKFGPGGKPASVAALRQRGKNGGLCGALLAAGSAAAVTATAAGAATFLPEKKFTEQQIAMLWQDEQKAKYEGVDGAPTKAGAH